LGFLPEAGRSGRTSPVFGSKQTRFVVFWPARKRGNFAGRTGGLASPAIPSDSAQLFPMKEAEPRPGAVCWGSTQGGPCSERGPGRSFAIIGDNSGPDGNAVRTQYVNNYCRLGHYVRVRFREPVSWLLGKPCERPQYLSAGGRPVVLRLIWSSGLRVVPLTFVPVSARVPACQQTARRWAPVFTARGRRRVAEPLAVWTLSLAVPREGVCRRPKAKRDTPDLGGRRRAETCRSDG
jgi:hypothetical protein